MPSCSDFGDVFKDAMGSIRDSGFCDVFDMLNIIFFCSWWNGLRLIENNLFCFFNFFKCKGMELLKRRGGFFGGLIWLLKGVGLLEWCVMGMKWRSRF